jgi:hypothetical protein
MATGLRYRLNAGAKVRTLPDHADLVAKVEEIPVGIPVVITLLPKTKAMKHGKKPMYLYVVSRPDDSADQTKLFPPMVKCGTGSMKRVAHMALLIYSLVLIFWLMCLVRLGAKLERNFDWALTTPECAAIAWVNSFPNAG